MKRSEAREAAFILLFEQLFSPEKSIAEILACAEEARQPETDDFTVELAQTTEQHRDEIDAILTASLHRWNKNRLSRVALTVLRLAIGELRFTEGTPDSVCINEAVELAKKYGGDEDYQFVNGVLGGVVRGQA